MVNITEVAKRNREEVFSGVYVNGKQRSELDLQEVYVTKEERERKNAIGNLTKAKILKKCKDKIALFIDDVLKEEFSEKLDLISRRVDATSKTDILAFYEEVQEAIDCLNIFTEFPSEN